jgi:hypothetical protein
MRAASSAQQFAQSPTHHRREYRGDRRRPVICYASAIGRVRHNTIVDNDAVLGGGIHLAYSGPLGISTTPSPAIPPLRLGRRVFLK